METESENTSFQFHLR